MCSKMPLVDLVGSSIEINFWRPTSQSIDDMIHRDRSWNVGLLTASWCYAASYIYMYMYIWALWFESKFLSYSTMTARRVYWKISVVPCLTIMEPRPLPVQEGNLTKVTRRHRRYQRGDTHQGMCVSGVGDGGGVGKILLCNLRMHGAWETSAKFCSIVVT